MIKISKKKKLYKEPVVNIKESSSEQITQSPKIRRLDEYDAEEVERLIDISNLEHNYNNMDTGFLLYNYGLENYRLRLKDNNNFSFGCFIGDDLVGCILCYPLSFLEENPNYIRHESKVFNELIKLNYKKLVWGEQITVAPNKRRKFYGKLLMKKVLKELDSQNFKYFSCMVSLYPNLNKAGMNFLNAKKDFSIFKTIKENNTVWALYSNNQNF